MKKILAFLASLTLIATSASSVVACGETKTSEKNKSDDVSDSVKLPEKERRKFALRLKNDLGIKKGNLWNGLDLDTWIDTYINTQISELFTDEQLDKHLSERLKMQLVNKNAEINFGKEYSRKENKAVQEVKELNDRMSSLSLFTTYTSAIAKNSWEALDFNTKYGPLNPHEVNGKNYKKIGIYFKTNDNKYTRWTAIADANGVEGIVQAKLLIGAYIPTQNQLGKTDGFVLVDETHYDDKTDFQKQIILDDLPTDRIIKVKGMDNISGREALSYRFQTYLNTEVRHKNSDKILAMQYMKDEMYRFAKQPVNNPSNTESAANQALYYNRESNFIKNAQNWKVKSNQQQDFSTDLKMVWTISLDSDQENAVQNANERLNNNQDLASIDNTDFSTYGELLDSLYGLDHTDKSTNILEILQSLTDITGEEKAKDIESTIEKINNLNRSDQGNDPIFGIKGFQGFTRNTTGNSSVEAVLGGDLKIDDSAKAKIARVNGSGVIKNLSSVSDPKSSNAVDFTFKNKTNQRRKDIIIVLPIYLIDLWKQVTKPPVEKVKDEKHSQLIAEKQQTSNEVVNLVTNNWVRLLPQVDGAGWSGNSRPDKAKNEANGWKEITEDKKDYPDKKSYRVVGGQIYVYLPDETEADFFVQSQIESVKIKFEKHDLTWEEKHNFAVTGIGQNSAKPMATNGQKVNFNVHLGPDANMANLQETLWADNSANAKRSDDLAYYLTAKQKSELVETLMYIMTLKENDYHMVDTAKMRVYRLYLSESDIFYKPLLDRAKQWLRSDDRAEESD